MEFTEGGRATIIHSRGYKLDFLASNVTVVVGGQEGKRQKLSITIIKSARNFKSWPCENLEPMLQKPRRRSRRRPIQALDLFKGGSGNDIAVDARS